MKKFKSGNLGGLQKHNEREFENHSNPDIAPDRSRLNYDLVNDEPTNYAERVDEIIDEQRTSTRAIRKDAVKLDEWIISSDRDFFNQLSPEETREFFQANADFFAENFGKQNLAYGSVHLDETTPHMHLGVVPMKDGRLSSKALFTREKLTEIQEQLPKYLQEKGFNLERGIEGSKSRHHSTAEYKKLKENVKNDQFKELSYKLDQSEKRNVVYEDILKNDYNVKKIEPREMKARLVLNDLENGREPKTVEQANNWLDKLKNARGTKIQPKRLETGIERLKQIISKLMNKLKAITSKA